MNSKVFICLIGYLACAQCLSTAGISLEALEAIKVKQLLPQPVQVAESTQQDKNATEEIVTPIAIPPVEANKLEMTDTVSPPVVSVISEDFESNSAPVEPSKHCASENDLLRTKKRKTLCGNKNTDDDRCVNACIGGGFLKGVCRFENSTTYCFCHNKNKKKGVRVEHLKSARNFRNIMANLRKGPKQADSFFNAWFGSQPSTESSVSITNSGWSSSGNSDPGWSAPPSSGWSAPPSSNGWSSNAEQIITQNNIQFGDLGGWSMQFPFNPVGEATATFAVSAGWDLSSFGNGWSGNGGGWSSDGPTLNEWDDEYYYDQEQSFGQSNYCDEGCTCSLKCYADNYYLGWCDNGNCVCAQPVWDDDDSDFGDFGDFDDYKQ